jgi:hypothetical protein
VSESTKRKMWNVLGMALSMKVTIIGLVLFIYKLIEEKIISQMTGALIITVTILLLLFKMVYYVTINKRKD